MWQFFPAQELGGYIISLLKMEKYEADFVYKIKWGIRTKSQKP
ncbi:MAG TPA: hypothetical protein VGK06_14160 [Methanosarcina sp.]|jgi:hypothetical protein